MAQPPPIRLARVKPSATFRVALFLLVAVPLLAADASTATLTLSAIWAAILLVYPEKGR